MGVPTTTRSIMGLALGLWVAAAGCTRLNAAHCGNQDGDVTCMQRGGGTPYCDKCEAANDGCVEQPVVDACGFGGSGTTASDSAPSESTATGSTTAQVSTEDGVDSSGTGAATCGDGVLDEDEACDGAMLPAGTTCVAAGYGDGVVGCADDCTAIDYSACPGYVACGNGELGPREECDGTNLAGMSCDDFPELTGRGLVCDEQCMFDLSGCLACRESAQPCDVKSDICCDSDHECRSTLMGPRCCVPGTGDCLLASG